MASGKAIGTTLVLGGGGATAGAAMGGAFSSKSETQEKIPESQTLIQTTEPTNIDVFTVGDLTGDYSNKLLTFMKVENLQYIVKPTSTEKQKNTKDWWDWSFSKKYTPNKTSNVADAPFNDLEVAYSETTGTKALNQACKTAYEKQQGEYKFVGEHNLLDNIKKFCTKTLEGHDVSEPKATLYTAAVATSGYELGVLTNAELAKKLVDVRDTTSDLWFKWSFEKRLKPNKNTASSLFNTVEEGIKAIGGNTGTDNSLKKACENAYKKNRHELTDKEAGKSTILKDIGKYCAATPVDNLTAPNTVPASEPTTGLELFKNNEQFTEQVNKDYKDRIISIIKKENLAKVVKHDHKNNRTWWDWAFSTKYNAEPKKTANNGKLDALFQGITSGYDSNAKNTKALNQACNEAYKKGKGEYKFGATDFLLKNIGQFCVTGATDIDISEPEPTFMTTSEIEGEGYKDGIFKGEEGKKNINKLVKATGGNNDLWWKWAHENLWKNKNNATHDDFKGDQKVTTAYSKGADNDNVATALNQICNAAYKKPVADLKPSSGTTPTIFDAINKFCKSGATDITIAAS